MTTLATLEPLPSPLLEPERYLLHDEDSGRQVGDFACSVLALGSAVVMADEPSCATRRIKVSDSRGTVLAHVARSGPGVVVTVM
jgi:hypothetical protein